MRILSRYVLREFLTPVAYCFTAFASLHLIFELFGEFDKIMQAKPSFALILRYIGGFLAADLQWLVTPSLLLGGLYAMWQLARNSEITAMRASGIGFSVITAPILMAASVFAVLVFCASEFYSPGAIKDSETIKDTGFKSRLSSEGKSFRYSNISDRRDWEIEKYDEAENLYEVVSITWTDERDAKEQVLTADKARFINNSVWWFEGVTLEKVRRGVGVYETLSSAKLEVLTMPELSEKPHDFKIEQDISGITPEWEKLSVRDMTRYLNTHPNIDKKRRQEWLYEIVNRFASPLACIFITLFAVPAGVATGRQSVFIGVVMAIVLFIAYYATTLFCGVQVKCGNIPIWFGITLPNLAIFLAGLYLYRKQQ